MTAWDQLGHARLSTTTDIYTTSILGGQRKVAEKLSEMMASDGEYEESVGS